MITTSKLRDRNDNLRRPIRRRGGRKEGHDETPPGGSPENSPVDAGGDQTEEMDLRCSRHPVDDVISKQASMVSQGLDLPTQLELMLNLEGKGHSVQSPVPVAPPEGASEEVVVVPSEDEKKRQKSLKQRGHVSKELVDTENAYVIDLEEIVEGYMEAAKDGPLSEGMRKIIFGNISQIYEWHKRTVAEEIQKYASDQPRLGQLFVRWRKHFSMYVKYCQNKPKSEFLVAEYASFFEELRQQRGHRLDIGALLIKPVQRLMKYQLLLKDMVRYSLRTGEDIKDLMRALEVMKVVPKQADDMMSVARIEEFPGNIMAQGAFLLQDNLKIMEQNSSIKHAGDKFHSRRVFLFDQSLIFAENKTNSNSSYPRFIYKSHIMINKMGFNAKGTGEPYSFTLINKKRGPDMKYHVQAPDNEVYQNWTSQIKAILDMQSQFLLALQFPGK